MLALGEVAVDLSVEEVVQMRGLEDIGRVLARGDDRAAHAGRSHGFDVAHGVRIGLDSVSLDELDEEMVLAGGDQVDEVFGRGDVTGGEDGADAVGSWFPVDVRIVVVGQLEGDVEGVEDLLPGAGVDGGGLGDDAVEVEEAGGDVGWEAQVRGLVAMSRRHGDRTFGGRDCEGGGGVGLGLQKSTLIYRVCMDFSNRNSYDLYMRNLRAAIEELEA